jgi:hypothetical protein
MACPGGRVDTSGSSDVARKRGSRVNMVQKNMYTYMKMQK